MNFLFST